MALIVCDLGQIIIGSLCELNLRVLYKLHGMRHIKLLCILIFYCIVLYNICLCRIMLRCIFYTTEDLMKEQSFQDFIAKCRTCRNPFGLPPPSDQWWYDLSESN